jgi:hypothetical protein
LLPTIVEEMRDRIAQEAASVEAAVFTLKIHEALAEHGFGSRASCGPADERADRRGNTRDAMNRAGNFLYVYAGVCVPIHRVPSLHDWVSRKKGLSIGI